MVENFVLPDMWDLLYDNSAVDQETSTNYVNLWYNEEIKSKPQIALNDRHWEFKLFYLPEVSNYKQFHNYIRNYAFWLLNRKCNIHD